MANNIVELSIHGITLKVNTIESAEYVQKLADTLNGDMDALFDQAPNTSVTDALVLCAIDYLDKYQKSNKSSANMRSQLKEYLADAASAKVLLEEERRKAASSASEAKDLKSQVEKLKDSKSKGQSEAITEALKEIDELKKANDSAVSQCKDLNDRITALNSYIKDQSSELTRLRDENDSLRKQASDTGRLKDQLQQARVENEKLFNELNNVKSDSMLAKDRVSDLEKQIDRLSGSKAQGRQENSENGQADRSSDDQQKSLFDDFGSDKGGRQDDMPNLDWAKDVQRFL
ncbi:MAG: cell division protein ZapA [Oscillospiraceae bacterium]|jgi:cell division protein ZapA